MTQTNRQATVSAIEREQISAIIRTDDQMVAGQAMQAAVDGGFHLIEFTLTTPGAFNLIADFSKRPGLVVGAGTVLTIQAARQAATAGARFLVSPIFDPKIVAEAAALDLASLPGAYTPTEMETAHRFGADFIKVFPAPAGGMDFIHALRGPLPHLRLFPTAGITPGNFVEYLAAGCVGVGFVRSLFEPTDLAKRDFAAIRNRAAAIVRNRDNRREK